MKKLRLLFTLFFALLISLASLCSAGSTPLEDGCTLEQVLIVSRHGIRTPILSPEVYTAHSPHRWHEFEENPGDLTARGGQVETKLGQYFQSYLIANNFMPRNWEPEEGEVRFFANSYQRTVATAQYFSSGLLPLANVTVERRFALNKKDPVFNPATPTSPEYLETMLAEITAQGGPRGLKGLGDGIRPNLDLLERVLDINNSPAAQSGSFKGFDPEDTTVEFTGKKYRFNSSVLNAAMLTDALIMQYYNDSSDAASFNNRLSAADWRTLGRIFDRSVKVLTDSPSFAGARNYYLLREMLAELNTEGRRFSFLCGHDTNLMALKTNLQLADYELPDTPVACPIGAKVVLEKWCSEDGEHFMDVRLVYAGADQIRSGADLTLQNPPHSCSLQLQGLQRGAYGLYRYEDVLERIAAAADFPFEM